MGAVVWCWEMTCCCVVCQLLRLRVRLQTCLVADLGADLLCHQTGCRVAVACHHATYIMRSAAEQACTARSLCLNVFKCQNHHHHHVTQVPECDQTYLWGCLFSTTLLTHVTSSLCAHMCTGTHVCHQLLFEVGIPSHQSRWVADCSTVAVK